eukprot:5802421-Pyramimonas_sp.AAC.1
MAPEMGPGPPLCSLSPGRPLGKPYSPGPPPCRGPPGLHLAPELPPIPWGLVDAGPNLMQTSCRLVGGRGDELRTS